MNSKRILNYDRKLPLPVFGWAMGGSCYNVGENRAAEVRTNLASLPSRCVYYYIVLFNSLFIP
jgi:hypothetical protein